jgi:cell wall-active antibiotic response 4TMS protein YvqF
MWYRGPSLFWGGVLVIVGVLFLLANTGVLENVDWNYIWPVILIALGVWLILARIGPGGATAEVDSAEPREVLTKAKLEIAVGSGRIEVRSAALGDQLYKTHIEHGGTAPEVKLDRANGIVRISQRLDWFAGARRVRVQAQVTDAIPWEVSCSTGAIRGEFDFSATELTAFDCRTGASQIDLSLAAPKGNAPIRIEGGALTVNIVRPAGAAIRVVASGGAVQIRADGVHLDGIGTRDWHSQEFDAAVNGYDVSVQGGALRVNVSTR